MIVTKSHLTSIFKLYFQMNLTKRCKADEFKNRKSHQNKLMKLIQFCPFGKACSLQVISVHYAHIPKGDTAGITKVKPNATSFCHAPMQGLCSEQVYIDIQISIYYNQQLHTINTMTMTIDCESYQTVGFNLMKPLATQKVQLPLLFVLKVIAPFQLANTHDFHDPTDRSSTAG